MSNEIMTYISKYKKKISKDFLGKNMEKEKELRLVAKGASHNMKLVRSGKMKTVDWDTIKHKYGIK